MPVKPYPARHKMEDLRNELLITISSRKQWYLILFLVFWLAFWVFGEFSAIRMLGGVNVGSVFMLFWLAGWTTGGLFAIYLLAWQLLGKEAIEVSGNSIIINRLILGLGFPKEYSAEHIKDLRISSGLGSNGPYNWSRGMSFWGLGNGLLAFDYGATTVHCAGGIDEAEAKQILAEIQQRYPQYSSQPKVL